MVSDMEIDEIKLEIIKYGRLLYEKDYITATDGNLSVRLEDGNILITPTGFRKAELTPEDLIVVDTEGNIVDGSRKPSMEMWMHLWSYESRSDISAIIHAHPPFLTAYSFQMPREYEPQLPEVKDYIGPLGFVPYRPAGSRELAEFVKEKAPDHNVLILQKHGVVCFGKSLFEAFNALERVEFEFKIKGLRTLFR